MLQCERHFGVTRGQQIRELIEAATNERPPCERGLECPLFAKLAPPTGAGAQTLLAVAWLVAVLC